LAVVCRFGLGVQGVCVCVDRCPPMDIHGYPPSDTRLSGMSPVPMGSQHLQQRLAVALEFGAADAAHASQS